MSKFSVKIKPQSELTTPLEPQPQPAMPDLAQAAPPTKEQPLPSDALAPTLEEAAQSQPIIRTRKPRAQEEAQPNQPEPALGAPASAQPGRHGMLVGLTVAALAFVIINRIAGEVKPYAAQPRNPNFGAQQPTARPRVLE